MSIISNLNELMHPQVTEYKQSMIEDALELINGNKITYESWLCKYNKEHFTGWKMYEVILFHLNDALECFGVEAARVDWRYDKPIALYLNTGDTYNLTIVYDLVYRRLIVTTLGDFVEKFERLKEIAEQIQTFYPNIEWEEWKDSDGASYYPIRLRLFNDMLTVHFGDSGFDDDHRGIVEATDICELWDDGDESFPAEFFLEIVFDLYEQILNN